MSGTEVVFLGGLLLALVLNGYPFVRLDVDREDGELVGTFRFERKVANVAVVAARLLLLGMVVGCVVAENLALRY